MTVEQSRFLVTIIIGLFHGSNGSLPDFQETPLWS